MKSAGTIIAHRLQETMHSLPLLTYYNERSGERLDLSAPTLNNWAAKYGNLFLLDAMLQPGNTVSLPPSNSWHAVAIGLGTATAGLVISFDEQMSDCVIVEHDQVLAGDEIELGEEQAGYALYGDLFGTTFSFHNEEPPFPFEDLIEVARTMPDNFGHAAPAVSRYHERVDELLRSGGSGDGAAGEAALPLAGKRYLIQGWQQQAEQFDAKVLEPLLAGATVVLVDGLVSAERLQQIIDSERVTDVIE